MASFASIHVFNCQQDTCSVECSFARSIPELWRTFPVSSSWKVHCFKLENATIEDLILPDALKCVGIQSHYCSNPIEKILYSAYKDDLLVV